MKKFFAILSVVMSIGFMISDLFGHEVKVSHLWSPASADMAKAVAYMTIDNDSSEQDTLTAIQTDAADRAVLQEETEKDGVRTTADLKTLDILGGQSKVLKPNGTYIVLSNLKKPLVKGESYPITFVFSKRGLVQDTVTVEDGSATAYEEH